jgi:hypothetical protein
MTTTTDAYEPGKTYTATFHPRVWVGDFEADQGIVRAATYDVTDEIARLGHIPAVDISGSDVMQFSEHAPQWVKNWVGPFWIGIKAS